MRWLVLVGLAASLSELGWAAFCSLCSIFFFFFSSGFLPLVTLSCEGAMSSPAVNAFLCGRFAGDSMVQR